MKTAKELFQLTSKLLLRAEISPKLEVRADKKDQMIDQDEHGALTLEPDQLRVLEEIIMYGGVQTVRNNRNHTLYAELLKKNFIEAMPLSKKEMGYNVTISGRLFVASRT